MVVVDNNQKYESDSNIITWGEHNWKPVDVFHFEDNDNYPRLVIYKNILKTGNIGKLTLYVTYSGVKNTKYEIRRY